jgi:glucosyl-dolichyl phosphate glucuronosyltransferase
MPEPILSVIVCTHERPADLRRCLTALAALQDPVEVIVVDSASTPDCRSVVEPFGFRYLYESVAGLSRARNAGIRVAGCPIVAFVDDDTEPAPDWAQRLVAPFADPTIACVGGTCQAAFAGERPSWLSDRLLQYAGITRFGREAREARSSAEYPFGANLALRRDLVVALGGFSETLGRIGTSLLSGEESALIDAVRGHGGRVWLEPTAHVAHHVAPERCTGRYYWRRLWWQGISRARAGSSRATTARIVLALPVRLALWAVTRDRFFLYRTAETVGYLRALAWR